MIPVIPVVGFHSEPNSRLGLSYSLASCPAENALRLRRARASAPDWKAVANAVCKASTSSQHAGSFCATGRSGGINQRNSRVAAAAPNNCATTNHGASAGRIPAKVSLAARASVTAGLANEVEAVNQ